MIYETFKRPVGEDTESHIDYRSCHRSALTGSCADCICNNCNTYRKCRTKGADPEIFHGVKEEKGVEVKNLGNINIVQRTFGQKTKKYIKCITLSLSFSFLLFFCALCHNIFSKIQGRGRNLYNLSPRCPFCAA